ncbi:ABC transporter permease [Cellulosilyticum ruminicola]|uniref:ABC transporter permease n=1 Tax=Cellulosilyticum ruminicola TaxID=425254 RepID=UPI000A96E754|nr:ABC transporter permease [Cellulosilyticum ruminicola]
MLNVIISEFYKIFKSKIFMILSVVLLMMFALILASNLYYGEEAQQLSTGISSYQEVYGQDITYYLILIFVTFLITSEYANGTIRQMTCHA